MSRLKEIDICKGIGILTVIWHHSLIKYPVNLWGDPSKAKHELGWDPAKTSFEELVKIMVDHDMEKVAVEKASESIRTNLAEYLEKGIVK